MTLSDLNANLAEPAEIKQLRRGLREVVAAWEQERARSGTRDSVGAIRAWLLAPDAARLAALAEALGELTSPLSPARTRNPDFFRTETALRWLAFFDGGAPSRFEQALARLRARTILEGRRVSFTPPRRPGFEENYLGYLHELRIRARAGRLPPFAAHARPRKSPSDAGANAALLQSLLTYLQGARSAGRDRVVIDLLNWEIVTARGRTQSRPACVALELLRLRESVSFPEFLEVVFGLPHYDPVFHEAKIRNLLNRLKALGLRIQTKEQRIYVEIGGWERFQFSYPSAHEAIRDCEAWRLLLNPSRASSNSRPEITMPQKEVPLGLVRRNFTGTFTRSELQQFMNASRSTAGRRLSSWMRRGLVQAVGRGSATTYEFVQEREPEGDALSAPPAEETGVTGAGIAGPRDLS